MTSNKKILGRAAAAGRCDRELTNANFIMVGLQELCKCGAAVRGEDLTLLPAFSTEQIASCRHEDEAWYRKAV